MRNAKIFINSKPVSEGNMELKIGDIFCVGSGITLEEYQKMGGYEWNKICMYRLEELICYEGGEISDDDIVPEHVTNPVPGSSNEPPLRAEKEEEKVNLTTGPVVVDPVPGSSNEPLVITLDSSESSDEPNIYLKSWRCLKPNLVLVHAQIQTLQ